ncbi:MAG: choice-of-anchor D domain-containing protein [Acidimicrobiia bacterium]
MTATLSGSVEARISGHVSGQIAVGNHIVQNNVDHGGIVYIAAPGETPAPRLRPLPISLPGRKPAEPLGRDNELRLGLDAIGAASSLEFVGPPGIGKTTLLKFLAYRAPSDAAPHGVVYHRSHAEPAEDTLQHLFEAFYETGVPFKPTRAQIQHALRDVEALIAIDDVEVGRDGVDLVRDNLPSCAFLLASRERSLWGDGRSIALRGLPPDSAVDLLELELMRPLTEMERPVASALVGAVGGQPLRIMHLASLVSDLGYDLVALAGRVTEGSASPELGQLLLEALDDDQRKVWEVLAALDGATLPADQLAAITGVADPQPALASLLALGLIQSHSPRYSVTVRTGALAPHQTAQLRAWEGRTREHLIGWAEANRDRADVVLEESEAVLAALQGASRDQAWRDLLRLGRAVEGAFVLGRRWGAWREILDLELAGARRLGDRTAEAWALHQIGTRALCLGDHAVARSSLTEALQIREALGDRSGAEATRHNLDLLPGGGPGKPVSPPAIAPVVAATAPLLGLPLMLLLGILGLVTLGLSAYIIERARPEPAVTFVDPIPGLVVDPARLDFGSVAIGTSSEPRQVTLTNDGDMPLVLDALDLAGSSPDAYRLEAARCVGTNLPAGASCTVSVVFAPARTGPQDATLVFRRAGEGQQVVLAGRGTDGTVPPPPPMGPLRLDPATVDFGSQPLNAPPVVRRISVTNTGPTPVDLTEASLAGPDARDFHATPQCLRRLAPGEACVMDVRFVAGAVGARSATLTVSGAGQRLQATLSGRGERSGAGNGIEIDAIGPQTVPYGGMLDVPVTGRAGADTSLMTLAVTSGPERLATVREGDGRWRVQGRLLSSPTAGPVAVTLTATAPGRDARATSSFEVTVVAADLAITWLQPLVDLTVGSPMVARALLTQSGGTQGDITKARIFFTVENVLSGASVTRAATHVTADGAAVLPFAAGELPLGAYTATAFLDSSNEYFRMASSGPVSVVVNSDVVSTSLNILSNLLGGSP